MRASLLAPSLLFLSLLLHSGCASPKEAPPPQQPAEAPAEPADLPKPTAATGLIPPPGASFMADALAAGNGAEETVVEQEGKAYGAWHLEFVDESSCDAFDVEGAFVFCRFGRFADAYVEHEDAVLAAVLGAKGLRWADLDRGGIVPPPPPAGKPAPTRGKSETIVRGGLMGLTGKGVIIAVVDSGIDFRHPDFITYDADGRPVSRILRFWDTTSDDFESRGIGSAAPVAYPNGVSVGTVYTREDLTAELRASERRIGVTDACGHGTACAGIAAGNGNAEKRYSGVAPEAEIVAVRVGGSAGPGCENTYLLGAACSWLETFRDGMPVVVSCSYGGHFSGHDGAMVLERQLDARFADDARGRAICISAGNERGSGMHGETIFAGQDSKGALQWQAPEGVKATILVFLNTRDAADIDGGFESPLPPVMNRINHPTGEVGLVLTSLGAGPHTMNLFTKSGAQVRADAYIVSCEGPGSATFVGPCAVPRRQIGTPGTTSQAITVGSYDFNDAFRVREGEGTLSVNGVEMTIGAISAYSNPGPLRESGTTKPEVVAPGQFHTACFPLEKCWLDEGCLRDATGQYGAFNGTSAATPYCAGVVALMLQKNPELTVGEIRGLIAGAAKGDDFTGETPNDTWGHGKLDLEAVQALLGSVPGE